MTELVSVDEVRAAARRIDGVGVRTPLLPFPGKPGLLIKPESLQPIGAFKLRGAYNAIRALAEDEATSPKGVVAHSSGNHGFAGESAGVNPKPVEWGFQGSGTRQPSRPRSRTGRSWQVTEGMFLTYEPNTDNEETVIVRANTTSGDLTATFTRNHQPLAGGTYAVVCRGNPGPWTRYDPHQDADVVPYFTLID